MWSKNRDRRRGPAFDPTYPKTLKGPMARKEVKHMAQEREGDADAGGTRVTETETERSTEIVTPSPERESEPDGTGGEPRSMTDTRETEKV